MINGRFLIKKKLGMGRSSVFLIKDMEMPEKYFAMKTLPPDAEEKDSTTLKKEFFTLLKLNHSNIIHPVELGVVTNNCCYDFPLKQGSRFFTMEYVEGINIYKHFKNPSKEDFTSFLQQISSVLFYLHQSNYIYYDLKPENIIAYGKENNFEIKLIDFGLAATFSPEIKNKMGTAEYISPEVVKDEVVDHRSDLYSLGMVLYKIVYNKLPFSKTKEIDIYKAHIEEEFDCPESSLFPGINNVIKKLLSKSPSERYSNTLEMLEDLKIPLPAEQRQRLAPAALFAGRKDSFNIINRYLNDEGSTEIFSIKGPNGGGKTFLLNELYKTYPDSVFIQKKRTQGYKFIKEALNKIIYNPAVYCKLPPGVIDKVETMDINKSSDFKEELYSIINNISSRTKFIIFLDDFNEYDPLSLEFFTGIFPLMQANKIKIILTENSDINYISGSINNLREINLNFYTESSLNEYLGKSFSKFYPVEDLKKLILRFSDMMPGNIVSFYKDLLLHNIISFTNGVITFSEEEEKLKALEEIHQHTYHLRSLGLTPGELLIAQALSLLHNPLQPNQLYKILNLNEMEFSVSINNLYRKNILYQQKRSGIINFSSAGLKKFIKDEIKEKKKLHIKIADALYSNFPDYNKMEISTHYKQGGRDKKAYEILIPELKDAGRISAYSYQKSILNFLLSLDLDYRQKYILKVKLIKSLINLGECIPALEIIEDLKSKNLNRNQQISLSAFKAECKIMLGSFEEGREIIKSFLPFLTDETDKQKALVELGNVEFELNNYKAASEICKEMIATKNILPELKGKCLSILGLIDIFRDNNLVSAALNFSEAEKFYASAGLISRVAQMEMNLGNIANLKGESDKAEYYWNKALELNLSIGSLEQEAKLLLNFGIYYYDKSEFEKSIENYLRALNIFESLGSRQSCAITLSNLGEIYTITCRYDKALSSLNDAKSIFENSKNYEELSVVYFLLSKLFLAVGSRAKLKPLLAEYKKIMNKRSSLSEVQRNCFMLIKFAFTEKNILKAVEGIKEARTVFRQNEDKHNYFYSTVLLMDLLLKNKLYDQASAELNNKHFEKIALGNPFYNSWMLYILSEVSFHLTSPSLKPPLQFLKEAYNKISGISITELTWKILFSLGMAYLRRGNTNKAKENLIYSKELIKYIADNIGSGEIKNSYLNSEERISAVKIIDELEEIMN
jgi:serine/threonine protein kinase/tetratricopeptide (TPR) repeat protein